MVRLYKSYVLPHLEYGSPLLLGIGNAETTKMENTNYYLLRSILGLPKSVSYHYFLKMVKYQVSEQRRHFQSLVMLYKCLYSDGAPYISKFVNFKNVTYNLRGLSTRLELPPFNLEYMNRSFTFLVSKLWNALPPTVGESKDTISFMWAHNVHLT